MATNVRHDARAAFQHALDVAAEDELAARQRPIGGGDKRRGIGRGYKRVARGGAAAGTRGRGPTQSRPEQLWNESWYFDVVAPDASVGAYVRIGCYPNMDAAWYTAFVCGPHRPTIAVVDFEAPLPRGERLLTQTGALRAEHPASSRSSASG